MESFFVYLQKSPYNMMLFGGALASGALLLWPLLMRPFRAGSEVTAFAAVQLINRKDAVVIDVRDIGEFEAGHIAGAVAAVVRDGKLVYIKELEKFRDKPVILVCRTGTRSGSAVKILRSNAFTEAVNLGGGIVAWEQAGMPLQKK